MLTESVSLASPVLAVQLPLCLCFVFNFFFLVKLCELLLIFGEVSCFAIILDRGESIVCREDFDLGNLDRTEGDLGRESNLGFGEVLDFSVILDMVDNDFCAKEGLLGLFKTLDFH